MKYCANDACSHLERFHRRAEYFDRIQVCSECGVALEAGEAPQIFVETHWAEQTCVRRYLNSTQAYVARAKLADLGIPSEVADQHVVNVDWLYSSAIGGVKLFVPAEYAAAAHEALASDDEEKLVDIPESSLPPDPDEICPRCGASGAMPSSRSNRWRALSLLLGFPFVGARRWIECSSCGNQWSAPRHEAA
jgi:hypothetical protein